MRNRSKRLHHSIVKSSSAIEACTYLRLEKVKSRANPAPVESESTYPLPGKRSQRKVEISEVGNKTPFDPPTFWKANEDDIGVGCEKRLCMQDPRWEFLHRGLKALGIIKSHTNVRSIDTNSNLANDDEERFYDPVKENLAEDSDEDDKKRVLILQIYEALQFFL